MQTQVQNESSVRLGNGVLRLNGVNVGLLKEASLESEFLTSQIVADNGKLPPRRKLNGITFKATLMEFHLENIQKIYGGEYSKVAGGTPVNVTGETISWTVGTEVKLANKNGDNTQITGIVVKAGTTTLTEGTDYSVAFRQGENYITPITDQTETVTVEYTYTPNERKVITYDDFIRAVETYPIEFVNTDAEGKGFGVRIFKGYAKNSLNFNFPSDEDLEAVVEAPIEFGAYPNEDNKYMELFDEQDV